MKKFFLSLAILASFTLSYAEEWSSTNVQYLYGFNFDSLPSGSTSSGNMSTVTLEHVGGWEYGSNFFFIDMSSSNLDADQEDEHFVYAEWSPKVSLSKTTKKDFSSAYIKDIYAVAELDYGNNFKALNLGVGFAFDITGFSFFDINLFSRKDNYNYRTFQITTAWASHFEAVKVPLIFEGFLDYYGTNSGNVIITHPRLLIDGKFLGNSTKNIQAGIELYCYNYADANINEIVPQLMLKWIW